MSATQARSVLTRLIAALLVVAVGVLGLRVLKPKQHMVLVKADFDSAGLNVRPGYEVRVRDMPAGTIKDITVDRKDFSAVYTLAIDPGVNLQPYATAPTMKISTEIKLKQKPLFDTTVKTTVTLQVNINLL